MAQIQKDEMKNAKKPEGGTTKGFRSDNETDEAIEGREYKTDPKAKEKRTDEGFAESERGAAPKH